MQQPFLFPGKDTTREKVEKDEIVYATVCDKYVKVKLIDKRTIVIRTSLRKLEQELPTDQFIRIHKNYIVNISHIRFINKDVIMKTGDELPVSKDYKDKLLQSFCIF
jgi:DNA-binding LytR/AlgR family response regulator